MTSKILRLGLVVAAGILAAALIGGFALAAGDTTAPAAAPAASKAPSNLSEYVGSKACLGCHTNLYAHWSETGHAMHMKLLVTTADFPADPKTAPADLQKELAKAEYQIGITNFFGKDGNGQYVGLNVAWDPDKKVYYAVEGGQNWTTSCAGCHTVNWNKETMQFSEPGIGCEDCHGPGLQHIVGKGDPSKIVIDTSDNVCAQCHAAGAMPDGQRWPEGLKPGGTLSSTSFQMKAVTPGQVPPASSSHPRQVASVEASGHTNAMAALLTSSHATAECAVCHSSAVNVAIAEGEEPPADWKSLTDGVSCLACHAMHSPKEENGPGQLRMPADQLCVSCHTGELAEGASYAPGATAHHDMAEMFKGVGGLNADGTPMTADNIHSSVTCVDCHMTDNNHMFKVIQPKDVAGTDREDTCTACHKDSPDVRQAYLDMWQNTTEAKLKTVNDLLAKADAKLKAAPNASLQKLRDIAFTDKSMVEADSSTGAHNFEYAMKLLGVAQTNLSQVLK